MLRDDQNREEVRQLEDDFFDWFEAADAEDFEDGTLDGFLEELEQMDPLPGGFDPQKSLDDFHGKHAAFFESQESGRRRGRWSWRAFFGVAAVAALVSIMTAQALGVDILGVFSTWTNEKFTFTRSAKEAGYQERFYPMDEGQTFEYPSLEAALEVFQVDLPMAPTWLPERFSAFSVEGSVTPNGMNILGVARPTDTDNQGYIHFTCAELGEDWQPYMIEKDENAPVPYESGGVTHYIMVDHGRCKATWIRENIQCVISGTVTEDEMKQIIDSIYPDEEKGAEPSSSEEEVMRFNSIEAALEAVQIDQPLAPKWLPERIGKLEVTVVVMQVRTTITALAEANLLTISYFIYPEGQVGSIQTIIEKDDNPPVLYESGGVQHYLMTDHDWRIATWIQGDIQCIISGSVTEDEMKQIIDSIYPDEEKGAEPSFPEGQEVRFNSIEAALEAVQIDQPLAPKWLPERYGKPEVTVIVRSYRTAVTAIAETDQGDFLIMSCFIYPEGQFGSTGTVIIEKDDNPPVLYESGGVQHYLMTDHDWRIATWIRGDIQCIVSGSVTEDEMKQIIDSIYS